MVLPAAQAHALREIQAICGPLDAGVEFTDAGAYLSGRDLAALCDERDERDVVERFFDASSEQGVDAMAIQKHDDQDRRADGLVRQSAAMARGWADAERACR